MGEQTGEGFSIRTDSHRIRTIFDSKQRQLFLRSHKQQGRATVIIHDTPNGLVEHVNVQIKGDEKRDFL